jgi:undecaprenyl-diphosphatase
MFMPAKPWKGENLIMQETSSSSAQRAPAAAFRPGSAIFAAVTVVACFVLVLAGYVQPVVMGVVQGLGEFLPISSSAHLILTPWFFGWQGGVIDSLTFDVALHLGTLVALLGYFWRDWMNLLRSVPGLFRWALRVARGDRSRKRTPDEHILSSIVIATVPAAVIGLLLQKAAESALRSPLLIAFTLTVMGVLLYATDHYRPQNKPLEVISWRDSLLIGLAQACALIPGVSRSGGTITMGRWLTFDRQAAARFSFLLSAPITAAVVLVEIPDMLRIPTSELDVFLIGVLVSGAVGALAISFLLEYIRRAGFAGFAIYRIVLAAVVLVVYFTR